MLRVVLRTILAGAMAVVLVSSAKVTALRGSVTWAQGFWSDVKVDFWTFDGSELGLKVLDEGDGDGKAFGGLDMAMEKGKCLAGTNGGFFGPDGKPLGLVITGGKTLSMTTNGSPLVGGVLYDDGNAVKLVRTHVWLKDKSARKSALEGLQGGPFLLEAGKIVDGLNAQRVARRTFVGTDGKGGWVLGVCSPMTLSDLAQNLARTKSLGGVKLQTVLNLDGGSSSCFWSGDMIMHNTKMVRNYVGIAPRPKAAAKK